MNLIQKAARYVALLVVASLLGFVVSLVVPVPFLSTYAGLVVALIVMQFGRGVYQESENDNSE